MKLKEILEGINFNDPRIQSQPDWEELADVFNLYLPWSDDTRLKCYHVKTHLCTDTWVGWEAYFLDGILVCMTSRTARRATNLFEFVSKEAGNTLRTYILGLLDADDDAPEISILNLEEEIPDKYTIEYNSQILHKSAWLGDIKVKIIKTRFPYINNDPIQADAHFHAVEIEVDGRNEVVDCRSLFFDYNTLD